MRKPFPDGEHFAPRLAPLGAVLLITGGALLSPLGAGLAALGIILLLLCCYSKRDGLLILGPVAVAELSRRARRPYALFWRIFFAAGAGAVVLIEYLGHAGGYDAANVPPRLLINANQEISAWFIGLFLAVVILLSLQLFPSAIVEDRIAKRWDLLRATDLRPREILLGKLVGRLAMVFEPVLVATPMIAILPMYGDVSPLMAASLLLGCFGFALSIAGIGLFYSVFSKNASVAMSSAIMILFLYFVVSGVAMLVPMKYNYEWIHELAYVFGSGNPFIAMYDARGRTGNFEENVLLTCWHFFLFHFALFWLFFLVAARRLPRAAVWDGPSTPLTVASVVASVRGRKVQKPAKVAVDRPPVTDDSVTWWERYGWLNVMQMRAIRSIRGSRYILIAALPWVSGFVIVVLAAILGSDDADYRTYRIFVTGIIGTALAIGGGALLFPPAFRAARCMAKERQADTLEPLVLTDLEPRELLYQKWHGICLCDLPLYKVLIAIAIPGVLIGYIPFLPVIFGFSAAPIVVSALAAVGLFVGVNAKSPFRSAVATGIVVYLLASLTGAVLSGLNQLFIDGTLYRYSDTVKSIVAWTACVLFGLIYSFAFFQLAVRRFDNGRVDSK